MKSKRKKKQNKITYEHYVLQAQSTSMEKVSVLLWQWLCGALLLTGFIAILSCFLQSRMQTLVFTAGALLYLALMVGLGDRRKFLLVLLVPPIVLAPQGVIQGLLYFINQWIGAFNAQLELFIPLFQTDNCTMGNRIQFLVLLLLGGVWLVYHCISREGLVLPSVLCILLEAVVCLSRLNMPIIGSCALLLGWIGLWTGETVVYQSRGKRGVYVLIATMLVAVLSLQTRNYTSNANVTTLRAQVLDGVDALRYGEDTLPKGELTEAADMVGNEDRQTLSLTVDGDVEAMYFKGYVAGAFDGIRWDEQTKAAYHNDNSGLMNWLMGKGLDLSCQYGNYLEKISGKTATERISIENTGADRRYLYLPYQTVSVNARDSQLYNDWQVRSNGLFGSHAYNFKAVMAESTQLTDIAIEKSDYAEAERVYSAFVREQYLTINDSDRGLIEEEFYGGEDWSKRTLAEVTERIRTVLQLCGTYSDMPQRYNGTKAFLQWFFHDAKSGNAAYYATAAVLAYRAAGVPARYVEGYYLSASDAAQYNADGVQEFALSEQNAHAWAEVYIEEIGWMPVEVVPGFYYAQYTMQETLGQPESSVNIVNQEDNQKLNGTTTDALESVEPIVPEEATEQEQVVRVTGYLVLVLVLAWVVHLVADGQVGLRRWLRRRKLERLSGEERCRWNYGQVCQLMLCAGCTVDRMRPYEMAELFEQRFDPLKPEEYRRFVQLIEKSEFGQMELSTREQATVTAFLQRLTEAVRKESSLWKKLCLHYIYAV